MSAEERETVIDNKQTREMKSERQTDRERESERKKEREGESVQGMQRPRLRCCCCKTLTGHEKDSIVPAMAVEH